MRLGVLFSGGKDSSYALYLLLEQGFEVPCLITLKPKSSESYMFHYPNIELTRLQAEAAGLPIILKETQAIREEELKDLAIVLQKGKTRFKIEGVVAGAIDSDYQKTRVEKVSEEVGLRSFTPLWRKDPIQLLNEQVASNFKAIICGVYAWGFNKRWLGKPLNLEAIQELSALRKRFGIHPSGEGGEYETLILDAPIFKKSLQVDEATVEWNPVEAAGTYKVVRAHLEPLRYVPSPKDAR